MFAISQDFAPPFKLIAPFFIIGAIFFVISSFSIFFFGVDDLFYLDAKVLSFVHLFLLGFVMMTIFGAMAQLVPVVLEVGHFGVELFYAIWPLLLIGTMLMIAGFLGYTALLPYGGVVVLISMMIFVVEVFLTIFKIKKLNIVMTSVLISNTFLFFGIIVGLVMALAYAGTIDVDISNLLKAHVYLVLGGYIMTTIMGLSVVLIPMFGLAHGFSMKPLEISIWMMSIGVVLVIISSFIDMKIMAYLGYALAITSTFVYYSLVQLLYTSRVRKEHDVYAISLIFAYISLVVSSLMAIAYFVTSYEPLLIGTAWLLFFGFFAFVITGHIYKIIPFLVWYEKFASLVGKEKVPMLADMVPLRSSQAQFVFCAIGVVTVLFAILLQNDVMIKAGAAFLSVGSLAFIKSVLFMMKFNK